MRTTMFFAIGAAVLVLGGLLAWLYTPDKPRPALETAYAAPPSQFVDLLGLRLHLRDTGPHDAAVVILLHGFGASLQADLDEWMVVYNEQRTHQGRWYFGKTPMQTFLDSAAWAREEQTLVRAA